MWFTYMVYTTQLTRHKKMRRNDAINELCKYVSRCLHNDGHFHWSCPLAEGVWLTFCQKVSVVAWILFYLSEDRNATGYRRKVSGVLGAWVHAVCVRSVAGECECVCSWRCVKCAAPWAKLIGWAIRICLARCWCRDRLCCWKVRGWWWLCCWVGGGWWLCCSSGGCWWLCCSGGGSWWLCCSGRGSWWLCCSGRGGWCCSNKKNVQEQRSKRFKVLFTNSVQFSVKTRALAMGRAVTITISRPISFATWSLTTYG